MKNKPLITKTKTKGDRASSTAYFHQSVAQFLCSFLKQRKFVLCIYFCFGVTNVQQH